MKPGITEQLPGGGLTYRFKGNRSMACKTGYVPLITAKRRREDGRERNETPDKAKRENNMVCFASITHPSYGLSSPPPPLSFLFVKNTQYYFCLYQAVIMYDTLKHFVPLMAFTPNHDVYYIYELYIYIYM